MSDRPRLRVVVTGAAGYMASMLLPHFAPRYELVLVDVAAEPPMDVEYHQVDLASGDGATVALDLFRGSDAVVHLGYIRSSPGGVYDPTVPHLERFETELANVRMAYNVYRASLEGGVRRVVVASSNHAADWYEHVLVHDRRMDLVEVDDLPLSDNFYGWSKAAYELLAHPFACGTFGRSLEVVLIRIGAPREVDAAALVARPDPTGPAPGIPGGVAGLKRDLGAYLSGRDAGQVFVRAIEEPDVRNRHGVPWLVVYGISNNTRAFWSLATAREHLGYEPVDDSELRFADKVRPWLDDPGAGPGKVG